MSYLKYLTELTGKGTDYKLFTLTYFAEFVYKCNLFVLLDLCFISIDIYILFMEQSIVFLDICYSCLANGYFIGFAVL